MRLDVSFDLDFSLCCGQVFRWKKIGNWWYGVVGENVFKIRQCGNELEFNGIGEGFVRHYFGINDDLDLIGCCIGKDDYIRHALRRVCGIAHRSSTSVGMPHQLHLRNLQEHSSNRANAKKTINTSLEKRRLLTD